MEFHGYQFQINQMFLKPQVFLIIHQHTFDVEFEIQSTVIASYFILLQYLISISKDINEKTLHKFLQREIDFYRKAFPEALLVRKSSRYVKDL